MRLKEKAISANTGLDAIKRAPIVEYDTGLKCIRIQDISQGKQYDEWGFTETSEKDRKKFLLKKNDLLIARTGATVGVSKIITSDINSVYNNGTIRLKLEKSVNPRFIHYIFQTDSFLQYIDNISCVATQPNLRIEGLLRFTIPDYSLDRQNKIVSVLLPFDELIENNNKRIKLLEQMAENLYKEWFVRFRFPGYEDVKFENGIPNEWEIKRLFEFGKIETGKTPSKKRDQNYGGDIMFIKTPDMHDNIYVISTDEFLSTEGHLTQPKKLLPENSIMVSCIGTGGVVAINDKPAHTNQQINSIILNKSEYLEWLYFVCKNLKETIEMFGATGSTMTNLSKGKFEKLKIVSPPEKVILEYHELTKNLFIEVRVLLHKNDLLAKQRDLLLPRLMSGKLEV